MIIFSFDVDQGEWTSDIISIKDIEIHAYQ